MGGLSYIPVQIPHGKPDKDIHLPTLKRDSPEEGKQIFEFVTYDSKVRKKALYAQRLKEAEPAGP
jgi:hypothetical protein